MVQSHALVGGCAYNGINFLLRALHSYLHIVHTPFILTEMISDTDFHIKLPPFSFPSCYMYFIPCQRHEESLQLHEEVY